jgi:hypothetical protein
MDTLYISSKSNWSITGTMPTWLEANPQTGNGNDTVIFRSLEMNSNGQSRTIELEITAYLSTSVKIIVTQKGKSASIGEGQFEPVRVYPVPSRGSFCVESQFPVNQITVFSSDGTILERREGTPGKQKEMFTTGRKGILFIKIQIADRIFIRKVVAY